jgi:hypothetical protein
VTESLGLLLENLGGAHRTAARLRRSLGKVTALSPLTPQVVEGLDPDQQDTVDAFLKRFEQLADLVGLSLFKGLAILEQEDVAHLSRRDLADLMEKLGIIPSAEDWSRVAVLRNRLAHGYPNDPARQASRLQEAVDLTPTVLAAFDALAAYAARKMPAANPGSGS